MRLNKYIAHSTGNSRRKSEELIVSGQVKVNDKVVKNLATQVEENDIVSIMGEKLILQKKIYYAVNKPKGYTTTVSDPHADKIIIDLVPKTPKVFPVGRLDKDSTGLIILTNDGDLAFRLTHPSYKKEKEYIIETSEELSADFLNKIRGGLMLEGRKTNPAKIKKISAKKYSIILNEGRKRQIRMMIGLSGSRVLELKRVRIANLKLKDIEIGEFKKLTQKDLGLLHE